MDAEELAAGERERAAAYAAEREPRFFHEPPPASAARASALDALVRGDFAGAAQWTSTARLMEAGGSAVVDYQFVSELTDADEVLGPTLEVYFGGGYYWVPFAHVAALAVRPPADGFGRRHLAASLRTRGGFDGDVFLPAVYAPTELLADVGPEELAGRATGFRSAGPVRLAVGAKEWRGAGGWRAALADVRAFGNG